MNIVALQWNPHYGCFEGSSKPPDPNTSNCCSEL